jgi:hypothetical protein
VFVPGDCIFGAVLVAVVAVVGVDEEDVAFWESRSFAFMECGWAFGWEGGCGCG